MEMKFCLLADYAGEGHRSKLLAVGIFDQVFASAARPIGLPPFYIAAAFEAHAVEGTDHPFEMRLVDEDGESAGIAVQFDVKFRIQGPGRPLKAQFVLPQIVLQLPNVGMYEFHFLSKGKLIGSAPLFVLAAPPL